MARRKFLCLDCTSLNMLCIENHSWYSINLQAGYCFYHIFSSTRFSFVELYPKLYKSIYIYIYTWTLEAFQECLFDSKVVFDYGWFMDSMVGLYTELLQKFVYHGKCQNVGDTLFVFCKISWLGLLGGQGSLSVSHGLGWVVIIVL